MKDIILHTMLALFIVGFLSCEIAAQADGQDREPGSGNGVPCPQGGCPVHCYASDDPHMYTFDGRSYEMQQEGKFYMYKHSTQPIWVQGFFQSCGYNGAFCSCGAAVRYFGETFIVDKCLQPNFVRANVVAYLGTGTSMQILNSGSGYHISLPGPLEIYWGYHSTGLGFIHITTYPTDLTHVGGLCGFYDGNPSNDFTWRTGAITPPDTTYPYNFADSWRVPLSEDLFIGYNLDRFSPCVGVTDATTVPQGVAGACFLNIPASDMVSSKSIEPVFPGGAAARRRRQTELDFPNGEWPNGWNASTAYAFCTNYLFNSPAVIACTSSIPAPINANPFIESCARDIQLTGGTSFASTTITTLQTMCVATLQAYSISDPIIMENLCPFNCSGNGACSSGECICNPGWTGVSCFQSTNEVPNITNTSPCGNCTPANNGESCHTAYVYGGPFVNSERLSADAFAYQVNDPLRTREVQVEVVYISPSVVTIRYRFRKCAWPRGRFALTLCISNDGLNYGSKTIIGCSP